MKVFCKYCKWLVNDSGYSCFCPKNKIYNDSWYQPAEKNKFYRTRPPQEINKNNDCKWFIEK